MHTAPNLVDAQNDDLARYLSLHAGLSHLLPAPEEQGRRDAFHVPHLDAAAHLRAAQNEIAAALDHLLANASQAVGIVAATVGLGAAAQVVALFVGGVL